jgi:hypothetical protein
MVELLNFALAAAQANVNMFVVEAFYDSGESCCSFKLLPWALEGVGHAAQAAVLACAKRTISQFLWFGRVHHGHPLDDPTLGEPL